MKKFLTISAKLALMPVAIILIGAVELMYKVCDLSELRSGIMVYLSGGE